MKKSVPAILILSASLLACASFVHPFGRMKAPASHKPLLVGAPADPRLMQIVERSCQNCHSERTDWPWYSYVAPMSWLIEKDVSQARSHMNLSHWEEYDREKQQEILARVSAAVRSKQMPLARYTTLHPEAKVSDSEIDQIYRWARAERGRLRSITASEADSARGGAAGSQ